MIVSVRTLNTCLFQPSITLLVSTHFTKKINQTFLDLFYSHTYQSTSTILTFLRLNSSWSAFEDTIRTLLYNRNPCSSILPQAIQPCFLLKSQAEFIQYSLSIICSYVCSWVDFKRVVYTSDKKYVHMERTFWHQSSNWHKICITDILSSLKRQIQSCAISGFFRLFIISWWSLNKLLQLDVTLTLYYKENRFQFIETRMYYNITHEANSENASFFIKQLYYQIQIMERCYSHLLVCTQSYWYTSYWSKCFKFLSCIWSLSSFPNFLHQVLHPNYYYEFIYFHAAY